MGLSWASSSPWISSFEGPLGPGVPVTWTAVQSGIAWRSTLSVSGSCALKSAGMIATVFTARAAVVMSMKGGYPHAAGGANFAGNRRLDRRLPHVELRADAVPLLLDARLGGPFGAQQQLRQADRRL